MPPITVTFKEMAGSPKESFDDDGFKAVMTLMCAWPDRIDLAKQLAGSATLYPNGRTVRTDPYEYPYGTGGQPAPGSGIPLGTPPVVHGVEVEPLEGGNQAALTTDNRFGTYAQAVVRATFKVPTWKKLQAPASLNPGGPATYEYVSESLEPSAEFITMPGRKLWWDQAKTKPVSDDEAPGLLVKMQEWTRTRHRVIRPHSSITDLMGCCNDAPITSEKYGLTFAAETLLYTQPNFVEVVMPDGTKCQDLVMRFMYRPAGWNRFWRAGETQEGPAGGAIWQPQPVYDNAGRILKMYKPQPFDDLLWK